MMTPLSLRLPSRLFGRAALVSLGAAALLCSCDDKPEPPAPATTPADSPAAEPQGPTAEETAATAREAVYRQLLERISPLVTDRAAAAEFNEDAKLYLETLSAYYEALVALPPSADRVDIGLRVANLQLNLGAYAKAQETFGHVQEDIDALDEAARAAVAVRRMQSSVYNGTGLCLINIDKVADAIPYYDKALETDLAILAALGVAGDAALPEGDANPDVSRAVADVLGSYRCLGECHLVAGDMEEARDIYKRGIDLMTKLQNLDVNSGMGNAYVKLHAALGDLENRCGKEREALAEWVQAANLCNAIFTNSRTLGVKAQAKRSFDALRPLILEKSRKLQAEAEAKDSAEAAREAEDAAKAAEEAAKAQAEHEAKAAEEAAKAEAEEKAAAAREAEKPKDERRRRTRRNRH